MTKERPILFSGAMVRAILDGRKTQTRRVLKPQPTPGLDGWDWSWPIPGKNVTPGTFNRWRNDAKHPLSPYYCPYGRPGDRLWVRESFWGCDGAGMGDTPCVVYDDEWHGKDYHATEIRPWAPKFGRIPSIHMPRNCSRITLEITGVRIERLNDCCVNDAIAEGADPVLPDPLITQACPEDYLVGYRRLWDSINGAGAWEANPWVWVVEFQYV